MMSGARYGLYFAPEDGTALARLGWQWLGRQPGERELRSLPSVGLDSARQAEMVADARRYGFHATLKPPFRLADPGRRDELWAMAGDFAAGRKPFVEPPFVLDELDGFLALRPSGPSAALAALAGDCIRQFDRLRAPATPAERQKRLAAPLTERQRRHVDAWGYPYVFEDFRLHLTLTCRLDRDERASCRALLQDLFAPALAEPVAFQSLCIFEQPAADAPFILAARFPFGG